MGQEGQGRGNEEGGENSGVLEVDVDSDVDLGGKIGEGCEGEKYF